MRFPYLVDRARTPQATLAGGMDRPRPILAVKVLGPGGKQMIDGHVDSGSDDTVFPLWVSAMIGLDVSKAPEQDIQLVGRGASFRARIAHVELRISDGRETCQWPAIVAFVPLPMRRALLGHAGFLQFFDSNFRGADR